MIVEWVVYALVLSGLLSVAAWLAERGARAQRWPARWVWAGALLGSVILPLWAWLRPALEAPETTPIAAIPGSYVLGSLPPLTVGAGEPAGPSLEAVLAGGWALTSLAVLGFVVLLAVRLRGRRRHWREDVVEGHEVLVSRDTGPAALGLLRGRVVLPEWALDLPSAQRRLLVAHEAEHVRARDPQLAFLGLLMAAAVPWNLPLWWQLRRLRLAIEMDCDARVLGRLGDRRGYGDLLLAVGQRRTRLALALAEPKSLLERRIRMITTKEGPATFRAVALGALAGLALVVACETPGPTEVASPEADRAEQLDRIESGIASLDCSPLLYIDGAPATDTDVEALEPEEIARIQVFKGEAAEALDGADCGVVLVIRKDASLEERERTRRLIEVLAAGRQEAASGVRSLSEIRDAPTFTPMHVRPVLENAEEVREALDRYYPPLLAAAGIEGTASVWFLVDREGTVIRTLIYRSSGYEALDQAALTVGETMDFTPAYLNDRRVPAWIVLDVRFERPGEDAAAAGTGQDPAVDTAIDPGVARAAARRIVGDFERHERQLRLTIEAKAAERDRPQAERAGDPVAEPTFSPMTERPRLTNAREVQEILMNQYPRELRDAGIGGTTSVWFRIDETGRILRTAIQQGSGYEALDAAALEVAERMEFTPARNGDEVVPAWLALDITFEVQ